MRTIVNGHKTHTHLSLSSSSNQPPTTDTHTQLTIPNPAAAKTRPLPSKSAGVSPRRAPLDTVGNTQHEDRGCKMHYGRPIHAQGERHANNLDNLNGRMVLVSVRTVLGSSPSRGIYTWTLHYRYGDMARVVFAFSRCDCMCWPNGWSGRRSCLAGTRRRRRRLGRQQRVCFLVLFVFGCDWTESD